MTVYVVAQLSVTDQDAYDRYRARFMGVFEKFDGRLLAADERPSVLEGCWERDKLVLLSFPDEPACRRFVESPEYQEIATDRKASADTVSLLVKGIARGN